MNTVLVQLIRIFEPNGKDWMGYKVTQNNPYTYHHIKERRYGGGATIDNGAILTKEAHDRLNWLELYVPESYDDWQRFFRYVNSLKRPLTKEEYEIIELIKSYEDKYKQRRTPKELTGFKQKKKNKRHTLSKDKRKKR